MHKAFNVSFGRHFGNIFRAKQLRRIEILFAMLIQNANQIDRIIGSGQSMGDGRAIADIRLNNIDPTRTARKLRVARKPRPPARNAHPIARLDELPRRVAPDKAGPAKNCHQTLAHKALQK